MFHLEIRIKNVVIFGSISQRNVVIKSSVMSWGDESSKTQVPLNFACDHVVSS